MFIFALIIGCFLFFFFHDWVLQTFTVFYKSLYSQVNFSLASCFLFSICIAEKFFLAEVIQPFFFCTPFFSRFCLTCQDHCKSSRSPSESLKCFLVGCHCNLFGFFAKTPVFHKFARKQLMTVFYHFSPQQNAFHPHLADSRQFTDIIAMQPIPSLLHPETFVLSHQC